MIDGGLAEVAGLVGNIMDFSDMGHGFGTVAFDKAQNVLEAAGFMVIFEVKGIKADGEDTKNNECEKLHCKTLDKICYRY